MYDMIVYLLCHEGPQLFRRTFSPKPSSIAATGSHDISSRSPTTRFGGLVFKGLFELPLEAGCGRRSSAMDLSNSKCCLVISRLFHRYKLRIRWPGSYSSEAFWQSRGSFSHFILIVVEVGAKMKTTLKPTVKWRHSVILLLTIEKKLTMVRYCLRGPWLNVQGSQKRYLQMYTLIHLVYWIR
jgi:hypothetical protein